LLIEKNIIQTLQNSPGVSDRELSDAMKGRWKSPQYVNQSCRFLASRGVILRRKRADGIIGNWLVEENSPDQRPEGQNSANEARSLSDKRMKQILEAYLVSLGWKPEIAWGHTHGVDINGLCGSRHWIIEVKGSEPNNLTPVNSFVEMLGQVLQRMDDPACKYSVAFPDLEQYRRLWERLPALAKNKTGITALFVNPAGRVSEISL
jgi:hypothetical protein